MSTVKGCVARPVLEVTHISIDVCVCIYICTYSYDRYIWGGT